MRKISLLLLVLIVSSAGCQTILGTMPATPTQEPVITLTNTPVPTLTSTPTPANIPPTDTSAPPAQPPTLTSPSITQAVHLVQGAVLLEDGRCCIGGIAGDTIQAQAAFTATSPQGPVTEMRVRTGGFCFAEADLVDIPWEPFTPSKSYPVQVAINWIGFFISVQYRDQAGSLSDVYCDDISVEGMPAPPSATP